LPANFLTVIDASPVKERIQEKLHVSYSGAAVADVVKRTKFAPSPTIAKRMKENDAKIASLVAKLDGTNAAAAKQEWLKRLATASEAFLAGKDATPPTRREVEAAFSARKSAIKQASLQVATESVTLVKAELLRLADVVDEAGREILANSGWVQLVTKDQGQLADTVKAQAEFLRKLVNNMPVTYCFNCAAALKGYGITLN
jgi:hypothetical protein